MKTRSDCELASHLRFTPSQPSYGYFGWGKSTHWGRVTHICVSKLTIIDSDNGLSPGRRQAIIWTNAGILVIGPLRTTFSEILIEIYLFLFKKMHLKMSSGKWLPFRLGLNVLIDRLSYCGRWLFEHDLVAYLYCPCCHRITTTNEYSDEKGFRRYWIIIQ